MAYDNEVRGNKRMGGRFADIALSCIVVTLPMCLFAVLLLGLVFHFRVTHNNPPYEHLQLQGTTDEPGIYYVNLNATFLVFLASWSSSVAPMLVSFVLALAAYPICRQYLGQAQANSRRELLTPYQLALTLRFMNGGGFGALWSWLKYHASWKMREPQGSALRKTAFVAIFASTLGVAIFLADTWLHVTTKTVEFVQISSLPTMPNYSLTLIPACTVSNNSYLAQYDVTNPDDLCSLNISGEGESFQNSTQSLQVVNNVSDVTTVLTYESEIPYTYLGIPQTQALQYDYTATTFGMQTQCKPISTKCDLDGAFGAHTTFDCASTFQGDLTQGLAWQKAYFTDSDMTSNYTNDGIHNPFYFAIAARINIGAQNVGLISSPTPPEIVTVLHGGIAFVISCLVSLYDIEYDSINNTVTRFVATPSNDSVTNAWQGSNALAAGDTATPMLQQASGLAILSNSSQELADQIALAYSRTALGIGAQVVMRAPALAVQERQSFLVSRVVAAPLFTLVIANLLFVVCGTILTAIAIRASKGDVREVQARLSIVGLVADRFEAQRGKDGIEELDDYFEEKEGNDSVRVAIDKSDGSGFSYKVWQKTRSESVQLS